MDRQQIFDYVKEKYGTSPEYLWARYPSYAVLRHSDNEKWYGIVMDVPKNKLGLQGTDVVDILDVKCDPVIYVASIDVQGLLPKSRLYVHLSGDWDTARKVGQRHGRPVIYRVLSGKMSDDGIPFYRSVNGVWLTKAVPVKYLKKINTKETGV
ncbi:MAG: RNA 2'-phosphotransferase [Lachnospiraceae bacterium]|nr:RNA 2'-phosphotransferase [Lachnospiraceae bacterium]